MFSMNVNQRTVLRAAVVGGAGVGMSAGIDMSLHLAAKIAGERIAQALQLVVEYDPDPPFDTGSPEKAGPELMRLALELLGQPAPR
ncbi:hypothetical protein [Micromonospora sp. DT62]|uniref:hypothetical protein n=1 Tax=Micromonospora sp. DT62 TaxID=3416521 RepID=UPI003CE9299E